MSIWKKINTEVLNENVNKQIFMQAIKNMGLELDENIKSIYNSYGQDKCDAAFVKNGYKTSLGIKYTDKKGIELVGDIWGTNLCCGNTLEDLLDNIAHNYQICNVKEQLKYTDWFIDNQYVENGKTVLEISQY